VTGNKLVDCPDCGWERYYGLSHIPELYMQERDDDGPPEVKPFDDTRLQSIEPLLMVSGYNTNLSEEMASGIGVYFYGPNGTGKTHLAAMIGLWAMQRGVLVRFSTMQGIINEVKAWYGSKDRINPLDRYINAKLLIVDDIGSERATENTQDVTLTLVNERMNAKRPTIYTSNIKPDALGRKLANGETIAGNRLAERIVGMAYPVEVVSREGSYRRSSLDDRRAKLMQSAIDKQQRL
jgi:DNA replication protein DnaC